MAQSHELVMHQGGLILHCHANRKGQYLEWTWVPPRNASTFGLSLSRNGGVGCITILTESGRVGLIGVPVLYAGAQPEFAGLDQVNVALTHSLRGIGETDVIVTVDGRPSTSVRINVQ